jgi:ribosomal-protein-alanine N-acetyltransferase
LEPFLTLVSGSKVEYILLEVRAGNREAQAFYERHGFRFLYRRNKYYRRPIEDALVLVRNVEPRRSGE